MASEYIGNTMKIFLHVFTVLFFGILFQSCKKAELDHNNKGKVYIGGEIVNPETDHVIFYINEDKGDTIYLDKYNRFSFKVDSLKEGLYNFKHNREYQLIYLQSKDSILLRLNTLEFDESLVFTGNGAEKNNFLINTFLINENERSLLRKHAKLSPELFKKKQDSMLQDRLTMFNRFVKKYDFDLNTIKVLRSSFLYDFYARHEMYLRRHYGSITDIDAILTNMPKNFYAYREKVNFNDTVLNRLYAYNRFLNNYIFNDSFIYESKHPAIKKHRYMKVLHRLDFIDSLIQKPAIKDPILKNTAYDYIKESHPAKYSKIVLNRFLKQCSNNEFKNDLRKVAYTANGLTPNNELPEQKVIALNDSIISLNSLLHKPINVVYFWSVSFPSHFKRLHTKVAHLRKKYPHVNFIAINIDNKQNQNWKHAVKRYNYDPQFEYAFDNIKCSIEDLLIYNLDKVVVVENDGNIIDSNAKFSVHLEKLLQQ